MPNAAPRTTSETNFKRLIYLRCIVLCGQSTGVIYGQLVGMQVNYVAIVALLLILSAATALTFWRTSKPWPVTDGEFFSQMLIDLTGLSLLLYFSGGATNPFVSYYLVLISISAATLAWNYTWWITGLSLTAYTSLMFWYQPLPQLIPGHHHDGGANLHIIGMWVNFTISAALITYFVVEMANALRARQRAVSQLRENHMRDEHLLAIATLAAGTAHELGTPLATMSVLLDEMGAERQQDKELQDDLSLLKSQLTNCKTILQKLTSTAEAHQHGTQQAIHAQQFLEQTLDHWQVLRPSALFSLSLQPGRSPMLATDHTLEQAIHNLLNNAADACSEPVAVGLAWNDKQITISIQDHGPGIPVEVAQELGKPFVSSKDRGMGIGLFLSHATIDRFGGEVNLYTPAEGGTLAEVTLPITHKVHG